MGRLAGIARREAKRAPMDTLEQAEVSDQTGVAKDFRGKPGKRTVTVISVRAWREVCAELGQDIPWTTRRANLLVDDVDLPRSIGQFIEVGEVRLEVTMEVDPCHRMDEQVEGLKAALTPDWRGGVGCTVLQNGSVSIGDPVTIIDTD
jgi:MOSC domain-containing protein YiiM